MRQVLNIAVPTHFEENKIYIQGNDKMTKPKINITPIPKLPVMVTVPGKGSRV